MGLKLILDVIGMTKDGDTPQPGGQSISGLTERQKKPLSHTDTHTYSQFRALISLKKQVQGEHASPRQPSVSNLGTSIFEVTVLTTT